VTPLAQVIRTSTLMPFLARPARKPRTVCEAQPIASAITHRLGDLRTAGALAAAQHGENLGALCIPQRPSLLLIRGRGRSLIRQTYSSSTCDAISSANPALNRDWATCRTAAIGRCGGRIKWSSRVVAGVSTAGLCQKACSVCRP
jgi:hypothetical protein